jgi:MFS family permease
MTVGTSVSAPADASSDNKFLFWACFLALVATAFGFMIRGELLDTWGTEFGLNEVEKGQINGVGVWPMGVSIVLFSLFIDKIGYGRAMVFAFAAHVIYAIVVICAPNVLAPAGASDAAITAGKLRGYWMLYIGNMIFALGNGTVEACVNPVVATIFSRQKTKWLNVLHAGWPGGLVLAGVLTIAIGTADWRLKVGSIFIPVLLYGAMMLRCKFPVNERVAAGASYREMLAEFGIGGALIVVALIVREMLGNDFGFSWQTQLVVGGLAVAAFGVAARSLGRPMLLFLMLIMIPLATTEIGTDGWITSLMKPEMSKLGANAAWVLVYTSFIMMILRFSAGPIVHRISPLGLLAVSSVVAACGLFFLSKATGVTILLAATIYGFGKTFFWPTMLGVVSERFPKGGALTLNATGGVGMLGVGVLGFPLIGLLQENAVRRELPTALYAQVATEKEGVFGKYQAVDPDKVKDLSPSEAEQVTSIADDGKKKALATMAIFPCVMLVCYLILIAYFRAQGGYQAEVLTGHAAEDGKFTGGLSAPVE